MTSPTPPTPTGRGTSDPRLRSMYGVVIVVAIVVLGLNLAHNARGASPHERYNWVLPVGLILFGIGGLLAPRHPTVHRVLIAVTLVFAIAGVVLALRP